MSIILSSIKRGLRDKNTLISNIFLALVLPYLFSIIFSFEGNTENINLCIIGNENSETIKSYVNVLEDFDKGNEKINLKYKIYSQEEANRIKEDGNNKKSDLVISIDEENKKINFEGSNTLNVGERAVEGITEEFFNSVSVYESISKESEIPQINSNVVKVSEYKNDSNNTNMNMQDIDYESYFAIVMLQMAILVGGIHSFKSTFYIKEKIGSRVKISPIKMIKLITLELIGSFILIFVEGIIMLSLLSLIYGVKVTLSNLVPVLSLIATLTILAVSIGVFATAISKKKTSGENVCSIIVVIMTLASGELMPNMVDSFKDISFLYLNPFIWISNELSSLLTFNVSEMLFSSLGIGIIASALLIIISTLILNRKAVK
ncbi:ABC transporter permease [Romboutsia ilealis]|uniref:ABC transporter permease n=1 Tax=Romboutsia faecis TaxID=2764597 RepID=A0ABR7JLA0_9FIRM|nr:ABC transporter permease [Romboutsia faecis]MBC5995702.1 ABC transporter permease [Romboutsia faecis]MRN23903.1 ABC transporter permease [Romboutsia ilealis]